MRIEPRQHLLETWKATIQSSWRDGVWHWGGRDGSNSISDAEQLLCILLPATQVGPFALDRPNATAEAMLEALRPLGDEKTIPLNLVRIATEYFTRYVDGDRPVFSGGSYFKADEDAKVNEAQQSRDIVDSFAISVTLSLSTIGFVRIFRQSVTRMGLRRELRALERLASIRLTAAMVGLLRSFSTHVFEADDDPGQILLQTINKSGTPSKTVVNQFRTVLQETIASFNEVLIGSGQTEDLESANALFECGWSWGIVRDAPAVELEYKSASREKDATAATGSTDDEVEDIGPQPDGVAENKPYLYFTVVAVDAIEDLFSERTRVLGLLNEEQQRLSRALQLRWDLTLTYWATVATFGGGPVWPLEDPPWQTTDGLRSEYYTLLVTSIVVKDLVRKRGSDTRLARIGAVLADLANEARVTRKHRPGDSGIKLHSPGLRVSLEGSAEDSADDTTAIWFVGEFASLLLQRCIAIAGLLSDVEERARLLRLADRVWDHLSRRRLQESHHRRLWDQPTLVFEELPEYDKPSWYYTERVVAGLVSAANLLSEEPLVNDRLVVRAFDLLYEAEHLYDMELMRGSADASLEVMDVLTEIRAKLERSRSIARTRPGAASALVNWVLMELDGLEAVRHSESTAI
ncbi:SCO2524 family protein [Actinoplanes sp. NPDC049802]|uniref:SCO2524 family protein n=1 Tax=Actinoplanes sp. NPDC049802 TaxID=3154742 RepID=UPI0033CC8548